jgi:glutamate racemase
LLALDANIKVISQATPLLVPLVEAEAVDSLEEAGIVRESISPWFNSGIDTMLLGCTHYPFLAETIAAHLGSAVKLVDPAAAVVRVAKQEMTTMRLLASEDNQPQLKFVVSGNPAAFRRKARHLTGIDPGEVVRVGI